MSTESLIINYSLSADTSSASALDTPYVRLEQVLPVEETATLGDVAEILEDLYNIDPCIPTPVVEEDTEEDTEDTPPFSIEEFNTSISQYMKLPSCFTDVDGNWSTQIKVILSDPELSYSLKLSNGIATRTVIVAETYKEDIEIESRKGILLAYPIVEEEVHASIEGVEIESAAYFGDIKFQWNGSVLVNGIGAVPPPVVAIGNTLYWGAEVTGSLSVEYPTKYFLVDVTVYGTDDDKLGDCSAICFYEKMVDTLDLQKPEAEDTQDEYCGDDGVLVPSPTGVLAPASERQIFYVTQTEWKCQCSGYHSHWTFSAEMTDVQKNSGDYYPYPVYRKEFGGYIDCGETTQDIATDEFYIQNCCDPPEFELPRCDTIYRKNTGGYKLDADIEASLVEEYGDQLQIVYVMPEDGECGKIITEQEVHSLSCCDEVPTEVEWDEDSTPEVLPSGSSIILVVEGGTGDYTFTTTSSNTYFQGNRRTLRTTSPIARLYANSSFCGTTSVSVNDGCTDTGSILIRSDVGNWVELPWSDSIAAIFQDEESDTVVSAGHTCQWPPFRETQALEKIKDGYKVNEYFMKWDGSDFGTPNEEDLQYPERVAYGWDGGLYFWEYEGCSNPDYWGACSQDVTYPPNDIPFSCYHGETPSPSGWIDPNTCHTGTLEKFAACLESVLPTVIETFMLTPDFLCHSYALLPVHNGGPDGRTWAVAYTGGVSQQCDPDNCGISGSVGSATYFIYGSCNDGVTPRGKMWKWSC